jgi:hypothetical protein
MKYAIQKPSSAGSGRAGETAGDSTANEWFGRFGWIPVGVVDGPETPVEG